MADRKCTNCGKSVGDGSYGCWLFHTCPACASEPAPKRWGDTGTNRKWRYFPRWHMTCHPELAASVRARHGGCYS